MASEEMKGDKEILLAAYQQMGLTFTPEDKTNSRSIVRAAVGKKGGALEVASEEMKGDRAWPRLPRTGRLSNGLGRR